MSLKERIESEARATVAITNDSLVCKDCKHRSPKNAICVPYPDCKPGSVLDGGDCKYYEKG